MNQEQMWHRSHGEEKEHAEQQTSMKMLATVWMLCFWTDGGPEPGLLVPTWSAMLICEQTVEWKSRCGGGLTCVHNSSTGCWGLCLLVCLSVRKQLWHTWTLTHFKQRNLQPRQGTVRPEEQLQLYLGHMISSDACQRSARITWVQLWVWFCRCDSGHRAWYSDWRKGDTTWVTIAIEVARSAARLRHVL